MVKPDTTPGICLNYLFLKVHSMVKPVTTPVSVFTIFFQKVHIMVKPDTTPGICLNYLFLKVHSMVKTGHHTGICLHYFLSKRPYHGETGHSSGHQYKLTTGTFENSLAGAPGYMNTAYTSNDIYNRYDGIKVNRGTWTGKPVNSI